MTENDPVVTATLAADATTLYSGEMVTYTLTLNDTGSVPAENLVDTIALHRPDLGWQQSDADGWFGRDA